MTKRTNERERKRQLWERIQREFPLMAQHMIEGKAAGLTFEEPVIVVSEMQEAG